MHNIERTLLLWTFLDMDENIQKQARKILRLLDPLSIVKFDTLINFNKCGVFFFLKFNEALIHQIEKEATEDMLSESQRCNDMVASLHFPRFFGTPIQCQIARRFPRSVVKVGPNVQCKNISILSGVQP